MNVDDFYLVSHHLWVLDISIFPDEGSDCSFTFRILSARILVPGLVRWFTLRET